MSTGVSESRVLAGDNPFGVDPDHYSRSAPPDYSDPLWSETHFWSAWNPDDGVGFFIHVGTTPEDADLWWAQVMVMLPGGRTLADMSWGRSPDRDGPTTGNFRARSPRLGHFTLSFDGAGEITSSAEMATRIVGAGRSLPFAFEIDLAPAMPVWDLFKATQIGEREWGGVHHEQTHSCTGWLKVAGAPGSGEGGEWRLDGCSFRDHSIGHRDFSRLGGDHLFGAYFPDSGRSIQTLLMWNNEGDVEIRSASIWENGELELIGEIEMTGVEHGVHRPTSLTALTGEPREFEWIAVRANGERIVAACQVQHTVVMSNTSPNTNFNGAALHAGDSALLLAECAVKVTWPDGDVGYGHLERGYRRNLLPPDLG
ncbi:MAG TPA: hypothetical protein VL595_24795 [Pseudonocardia sp.]|nr:hypothetical protein [Pseudonocardia sp.]